MLDWQHLLPSYGKHGGNFLEARDGDGPALKRFNSPSPGTAIVGVEPYALAGVSLAAGQKG
jgi:hypothetical protein